MRLGCLNGREDEPRGLSCGIASDAGVAEASLSLSMRLGGLNGRADEPRGLSCGIASDAAVTEAALIPLK